MDKLLSDPIEREKILNFDDYPKASILKTLSKGADPMLFNDWVNFFIIEYGLKNFEAYQQAEALAEHYFDVPRFKSYESYRKTINSRMKKRKLLPDL
ncbi:MAG: hypothetical protein RBS07_13955 [Lentimicrobium sp.]|jgi:hypothetical protein|nr:hypothetical protein [Lentimicrobium sp.]